MTSRRSTPPASIIEAVDALALWRPDFVVVEEPFAHPRYPLTGMTLAKLCGRWVQELERAGFGVVTVPPSMWQPAVLPGFTPRMRSAERKDAAQALALREFGVTVTPDEADAVGLALYAARNVRTKTAALRPGPTATRCSRGCTSTRNRRTHQ